MTGLFSWFRGKGTLEGRVQLWGLTQLVIGFLSVIIGVILTLSERREWKVIRDPEFIHTKTKKDNQIIILPKLIHEPIMEETITTIVPRWNAMVAVMIGGYIMFMGIILLIGVYQSSGRKCTAWFLGMGPLIFALLFGSAEKLILVPSLEQLVFAVVLWGILGHCLHTIWSYKRQCRNDELRAEMMKEG